MREQYVALDELVHTLQLKYESDSDDGDVHIDSSKVAHHLQWCSFSSMSLVEGMHADNSPHESAQVRTSEQEQNSEAPGLYTEELFMPDNENEQYENEFEEDAWCTEVEQDMTEDVNQNLSWNELVQTFAEAVTVFIKSVSQIRLDIHKDVREEPPTRPIDVVRCSDKTYRALLVAQTAKLEARFGFTATQDIWNQRKCLIQCYTKKGDCRRKIKENEYAPLQQGWDEVAAFGNFEMVCNFTIGLASIAPGTHTVEGDFSTLKRVMGPHRGRLSNYAMEGELQARQYFQLMSLANEVGSDEAHEALE
ncbi:hypothetical protein PF005_g12322 [Phytophthora fragariae]|uniref:Uncharacterized protein n=1 Tax=Phytophthora fragariae TaxID=53985 RepID=A0A6A3EW44_9STRA|nr:hypothetical protein PF003_g15707 [Phytophthora fragariae]KAE8936853.1 hypothetical protein PF009_g13228 [Phytophthora fragariae]KAE8999439.1 hypothetical protein PF011_g14626 [Phytophthora fragariae]KAE9108551.1 hypothetical protein PF007_g12608 [Phytophthora fragariae]KAE9147183.1 hypothetical protein PF006_g8100 [Phytophthora fragariae]